MRRLGQDDTLLRAVDRLIAANISGLPVVNDKGRRVGVLSEKDLLKIFYEPDARSGR